METLSLEQLQSLASDLARRTVPSNDAATGVTLSGALGAGKTTFAQAFAKALGVEEDVTSPTFVIERIYRLNGQRFDRLIHIDAYRLSGAHELEALGWRELAADPRNLILVEWPEKVTELIPEEAIRVRFDIAGEKRTISINGEKSAKG
ncbi:MAG TPA: tRNA (adenosine(37)-N6)-threonylcarbamoyltransferase complex ATPase subunit type 1 TsaE [Candidatus Paceibacterota bacterium]|jgi:tRNA threonylcarbamoyladenosine biosynthesis protein TsaE|nr:tRNA (adenosine(37)-N6)-threonylcarbamoyltransferase complex ATPase subunit type 1 TsaE [Candidatus Paceibacterota bacterium]